jgi:hypothetical protein
LLGVKARADTLKDWCSGRRKAPRWFLNFAIIRIGELTKLAVEHCFAAAVQAAGHHRYSRSHSLEKDEPESLLPPGHYKNVGDAIVVSLFPLQVRRRETRARPSN